MSGHTARRVRFVPWITLAFGFRDGHNLGQAAAATTRVVAAVRLHGRLEAFPVQVEKTALSTPGGGAIRGAPSRINFSAAALWAGSLRTPGQFGEDTGIWPLAADGLPAWRAGLLARRPLSRALQASAVPFSGRSRAQMVTTVPFLLIACLPVPLIITLSSSQPKEGLKEASRVSRLGSKFKLEHERRRGQKTPVAQSLKAIRGNLPRRTLRERIRFC